MGSDEQGDWFIDFSPVLPPKRVFQQDNDRTFHKVIVQILFRVYNLPVPILNLSMIIITLL